MSFIAFKISDYEHTAEREQYRTICNLLRSKYEASDELCLFIANYNIFDCELDGILIKSDAIISIEFKNYGGEIKAVENGHWACADGTIIKGGSRKSVYQQAKLNHVAIKRGLKEGCILPNKMLKNIPSLIVFAQPIVLQNNLSEKVKSWLHVCDTTNFIDKVEDITTAGFSLSSEQILELIPKLGLLDEFIDSRFSVGVNLPSKGNVLESTGIYEAKEDILPSSGETFITASATFDNLEKEVDSIKIEYTNFIDSLVIPALGLSSDYKLMIVHYNDFETIMRQTLSFKSEYVAILQTKNADSYIPTLKRLFNKDVLSLSSEVIVWGEGDFELESYQSSKEKIIIKSCQNPFVKEEYKNNPFEIKLPSWLDDYIFKRLNAKYQPSFTRFSYNLDLNKEECKVYLGTYFPRSFAEGFMILDSILYDSSIISILEAKKVVKILDFGCGSGGELFGFLHALEKNVKSNLLVKIIGIDGNHNSLRLLENIIDCYNSRERNKVEFVVAPCFIESESDLSTISDIIGTDFDFIITSKAIGEFENKKRIEDNGYEFFAKIFAPRLCKTGIMTIIDVTTKNEQTGLFLPQIMNIGVNAFISKSKGIFKSIAPCSGQTLLGPCKHSCFYRKDVYISHSAKINDRSKFAVRLITRKELNLDETYVREVFNNSECKLNK